MSKYIEIENLEVGDYITIWDCKCSEFGRQTVMAVDDLKYLPTADVVEKRDCEKCINFGKHATEYPCSHCRNCYTDKFQPIEDVTPQNNEVRE